MNFDTLAVVVVIDNESAYVTLELIKHIYQCSRDVTTNTFTVEKVSLINNNINVLENEIEHSTKQYEVILLAGSFRTVATTIFSALSIIYKEQLVDAKDTFYHRIGATDCKLKLPYYCKRLSIDDITYIYHMQQVYIINTDSEHYIASVDYFVQSAFRTMRRFVIELHLTEDVPIVDLNTSSRHCDDAEVEITERRVRIIGNTLKIVNAIESDVEKILAQFVYKRYFVDDYMQQIIECDDPHIKEAITIITDCLTQYKPENVFLCFNGGKDCTVLLHLLLCILRYRFADYSAPIICLYVEHRNPFPEIRTFVQEMAQFYRLHVITERQGIKDSLGNMLDKYGGLMKACLMGTRNTDPFSSHLNHFHMTDPKWPQIMRVSPLLNWHYGQIWQYLRNYQVPYCCLYDQGYTSLGSIVNTLPNAALQYRNISANEIVYMPAYKLLDVSLERNGRVANVS